MCFNLAAAHICFCVELLEEFEANVVVVVVLVVVLAMPLVCMVLYRGGGNLGLVPAPKSFQSKI